MYAELFLGFRFQISCKYTITAFQVIYRLPLSILQVVPGIERRRFSRSAGPIVLPFKKQQPAAVHHRFSKDRAAAGGIHTALSLYTVIMRTPIRLKINA